MDKQTLPSSQGFLNTAAIPHRIQKDGETRIHSRVSMPSPYAVSPGNEKKGEAFVDGKGNASGAIRWETREERVRRTTKKGGGGEAPSLLW